MLVQQFFHLDCHSILPECGCQCDKCIDEILAVLEDVQGVSEVSTGERDKTSGILVRYDPEITSESHLISTFRKMPSFYENHFVPQALD